MILCIETSGEICSVALAESTKQFYFLESQVPNAHSAVLLPFIDRLFTEHQISKQSLSAIALSSGPGSYTGLRIGSAAAKSICLALNIPLITISSLEILAQKMKARSANAECLVPLFDARRMEVYAAVFDVNANRISADMPIVLSKDTAALWNHKKVLLAGSGAAKTHLFLKEIGEDAELLGDFFPDAPSMLTLAFEHFENKYFTDIVNFEPAYLKPFYTTATPIKYK